MSRPPPRPAASATTATSAKVSTSGARSATSDPTSVPASGDGKLVAVAIPGADSDRTGRRVTFSVDVEGASVSTRPRSPPRPGPFSVTRVAGRAKLRSFRRPLSKERPRAVADIRITLAGPHLTDQLCAPSRPGQGLVQPQRPGGHQRDRWTGGVGSTTPTSRTIASISSITRSGHGLWQVHGELPWYRRRRPHRLQQTLGLQGCTAWPWPQQNG